MSTEAISTLSVGVAILATLVMFFRWIRQDVRDLEARLNARMEATEERLNARMEATEERLNARMEDVETRLYDRMEAMEARLYARMEAMTARIDLVNSRIDSLFIRSGSAA